MSNSLNSRGKELLLNRKSHVFAKKRTTSKGRLKFSKFLTGNFQFHSSLLLEFLKFPDEWLAFRKFYTSQIFGKLCQEISVPLALVPKFPEFLVEWKAPNVPGISGLTVRISQTEHFSDFLEIFRVTFIQSVIIG